MSMRKRSIWDALGKIFKGNKELEIPEGCDFCEVCGKIFPNDELHHVLVYLGNPSDLVICEDCSDKSPTEWRRNFEHKRDS